MTKPTESTWMFLFAAMLAACSGGDAEAPDSGLAEAEADAGDAQGQSGYRSGFETDDDFVAYTDGWTASTSGAHAQQVQIWYSSDVDGLLRAGTPFEAPVGATAIKRRDSNGDGETNVIYVMTKQAAGYDAVNGDWYYEVRSGDGESVSSSGALRGCIGCHAGGTGTDFDYLRGTELDI